MDAVQWMLLLSIIGVIVIPCVFYLPRSVNVKEIPARCSLHSVSYSPFAHVSSIDRIEHVDAHSIRQELSTLKQYVHRIRTYSMCDTQELIPGVAEELGMDVSLGIWLDGSQARKELEIAAAIDAVKTHKNIVRVIVGNESLFRHDAQLWELKDCIDRVKQAVDVPVTTAELWYTWLDNPSLADHVDEITAHILPFWEGLSAEASIDYVFNAIATLTARFPGKKIYIGEIGWPSRGQIFISTPCDPYQQALYIRSLAHALNERQIEYNVVEAFDQKWKISEGTVGRHWGILTRNGEPKLLLGNRTTVPEEGWAVFVFRFYRSGAGKVLLSLVYLFLFLCLAQEVWQSLNLGAVWDTGMVLLWSLWFFAVSATGLHETVERFLMPRKDLSNADSSGFDPASLNVAFHLACRNEPPAMVIQTLTRLSQLDYGHYQVHVIDSNTVDRTLWTPVKDYCQTLGDRFHFWHVDELSGFKSGALNYLLDKTDDDTDVIAIVDSDYHVQSDWLKLLFFFADPSLAVIQSPQDYRDRDSMFKELCYFEYKSFFNTGMVIRDHFNAIILHGTMTLIKADVLRKNRWAEWCVCEDAELGLRILMDRYKMKYLPVSYGQGVMPDTFADYKRQRARWVTGAVHILSRHFSSIFTLKKALAWQQKYQFIAGWAHWLMQPMSVLFTVLLLGWPIVVHCAPEYGFHYPILVSLSSLIAFAATLLAQILLYVKYSPDGARGAWLSIVASQALNYTVGVSVAQALFKKTVQFVVTPKLAEGARVTSFPFDCRGELVIFLAAVAVALWLMTQASEPGHLMWASMLMVRSLPYGLAVLMSISSLWHSRRQE